MKALLFPGQGSQVVGMGHSLYDNFTSAREVFNAINDSLGFDLTKIMFEGPEDELKATENAQPAIMAVSVALTTVLQKEFNFNMQQEISFVAGHSLGEYSALTVAGVLDIKTCAEVLKIRGRAMSSSTPNGVGGMVAVLGINDMNILQALVDKAKVEDEVCVIANDNCMGQAVISGNMKSIDNVVIYAKEFGAIKAIKLAVSGSFHSPLMQKASETIAETLSKIELNNAIIPLISNVTAKEVMNKDEIKVLLVEQVVKAVKWRESIEYLVSKGVDTFIEVGHGNVLNSLVKRIDKNSKKINLQEPKDIEAFITSAL